MLSSLLERKKARFKKVVLEKRGKRKFGHSVRKRIDFISYMTVPTVISYMQRSIKTGVKKKKEPLNSCDVKMNGLKNVYFPLKLVPVWWYVIIIPALWRPRQEA